MTEISYEESKNGRWLVWCNLNVRDSKLLHRWRKWWKQSTCRKFCTLNGCLISKKRREREREEAKVAKRKLFNKIYGFSPVINVLRLCKWYLHLQRCVSECVCDVYLVMRIIYIYIRWNLMPSITHTHTQLYGKTPQAFMCVKIVHSNSCLYVSYLSSFLNFQITHLFLRYENLHLHNSCQLNVLTGWQKPFYIQRCRWNIVYA